MLQSNKGTYKGIVYLTTHLKIVQLIIGGELIKINLTLNKFVK